MNETQGLCAAIETTIYDCNDRDREMAKAYRLYQILRQSIMSFEEFCQTKPLNARYLHLAKHVTLN